MLRSATPGATKLPAGARDRETLTCLQAEIHNLGCQLNELNGVVAKQQAQLNELRGVVDAQQIQLVEQIALTKSDTSKGRGGK